jgi:hypothetical protein
MARLSAGIERAESLDGSSDTSASSCIKVARDNTTPTPPRPATMDSARSSIGASSLQSTPPTSLGDMNSEADASKEEHAPHSGRRSVRPRTSIGTYNDKINAGTAVHTRIAFLKDKDGNPVSRNVSGATLVGDSEDEPGNLTLKDGVEALDKDWTTEAATGSASRLQSMDKLQRRQSTKRGQLEHAATQVAGAVSNTATSMTSALGKRVRGALASTEKFVSRRVGFSDKKKPSSSLPPNKVSRLFPNIPLKNFEDSDHWEDSEDQTDLDSEDDDDDDSNDDQAMPRHPTRKRKRYMEHGLYVGQSRIFNPRLTESKNKQKLQSLGGMQENSILPLPMFTGEETVKHGRDFVLPYDILNPLPRDEAPKGWSKLNKSTFASSQIGFKHD